MSKRRLAIVGTGGTIASVGRDSLDFYDYTDFGMQLGLEDLLDRATELRAAFDILPVEFKTLSSTRIVPQDWLALNRLLHSVALTEPVPQGIVVMHGTSTLEETAYFLNLVLRVTVPVVLVGAQRPHNTLSSDGPMNLLNAARAANAPALAELGVVVLMNDQVHAAREVTKASNYRLDAFDNADLGALGSIEPDGDVRIYRKPTRRHMPNTEFDVRGLADLPRVDIAYSYAGADRTAIDAFAAAGTSGIVSAGMAPGLVTPAENAALKDARRRGIVIVQSSRAASGRVLVRAQLQAERFVAADNLNPQKARVLAMVGLTKTQDTGELQRIFNEY